VRALLAECDSFRAAHNIASLQELGDALTREDDTGQRAQQRLRLADLQEEERIELEAGREAARLLTEDQQAQKSLRAAGKRLGAQRAERD